MVRVVIALAAVCLTLGLPASARAQTPEPTPVSATQNVLGYRIVISGPPTSAPDQPIAYTLEYQWVAAPNTHAVGGLVLSYEFGTLVSVTPESGAAPTDLGPQDPYDENYDLNGDSGTLRVVVKPPAGFTGLFGLGFYVRGTDVSLPEGTVVAAMTLVAPPGWMVITGAVPAPVGEHVSVEAVNTATKRSVSCDSMTSRPWPVPGQVFAPASEPTPAAGNQVTGIPTYFGLIVAPSCLTSPTGSLRICWSPDLPPSPPPAVDTRPCYTGLTFTEGLHALGLILPESPTPGTEPPSTATSEAASPAIVLPGTGREPPAGDPSTPAVVALALASLTVGGLACGLGLWRAR